MALTKIGKEGVTGISNSSNATAITIDSSENVGIGGSPSEALEVHGTTPILQINDRGLYQAQFCLIGNDLEIRGSSGSVEFYTGSADGASSTERMRIAANGVTSFYGTNQNNKIVFNVSNTDRYVIHNIDTSNGSGFTYNVFQRGGSGVGSIAFNGTGINYNTTSDYRLKENVTATWDATTRLKQLNPVRFNFIADADTTVDGFLAHEVQTVVPEAIHGTHNQVETWTQQQIDDGDAPDGTSAGDNKLDGDGNTIPVYQGIDQSKLVPLLVKTIQELEARIVVLENA